MLIALPLTTFAHHGLGGRYDQERIAELEGEVIDVLWRNPHIRLTIKVTDGEAESALWAIEGSSPTGMQRRGITDSMLSLGDRIRVAGFASIRGQNEMIIHNMLLPDGRELVLSSRYGARWSNQTLGEGGFRQVSFGDSSAPELGIYRVWNTVRTDSGSYPLFPENATPELADRYPLTEEARTILAAFNPATDNPIEAYCLPKGMPMVMEQPLPMEFIDQGATIIIRLEEYDTVRTVYMDGSPAAESQPSPLGSSVGRWEDTTLVVSTSSVDWPYFNQMGIPQSPQAELVERFTPSADGSRLDYRLSVTDPETFTEPTVLEKFWIWVPGIEVVEYNCAESG